jgi:ribosomal-protein-alanine N-acetyltransferase
MALPGAFGLLAVSAGAPVGFLLAQVLFEEAELLTLGVLPTHRRAGHGCRLLQAGLAEASGRGATRMHLEVAQSNLRAQFLYGRAGFMPAGRRRNYYRQADGTAVDALLLARPLVVEGPDGAA